VNFVGISNVTSTEYSQMINVKMAYVMPHNKFQPLTELKRYDQSKGYYRL